MKMVNYSKQIVHATYFNVNGETVYFNVKLKNQWERDYPGLEVRNQKEICNG